MGRGKQLGSESRCILGTVALRRLDFSVSCMCSQKMPWLQCVFSLLYLWGPSGTAHRTISFMANENWMSLKDEQRGSKGSRLALHYLNCRERNRVWNPGAHPAICDCKWPMAILGPGAPLLPQLPGTRITQVAITSLHLRAPVQSFPSSQ